MPLCGGWVFLIFLHRFYREEASGRGAWERRRPRRHPIS